MKLYYKTWVDCILKARAQAQNKKDWKVYTMIFMSMTMALNLVLILFILHDLRIVKGIFKIPIDIFPGTRIDAFFSFFFSYFLPFLLLNYFLIFHKDRYQILIKKYPYQNGKLFIKYFLGSLCIFLGYILIAVLIAKYYN